MKTKIMQINGFDIEYYDSKTKSEKVIFFVHGLGSSIRQWEKQIEYFEEKVRVISVSFQGHGRSEKPSRRTDYLIESYRETTIDLLRQLKVKRCIWVGNSMGGVIGYSVLEKEPAWIEWLITNGTAPVIELQPNVVKLVGLLDQAIIKCFGFRNLAKFAANHTSKNKEANAVILKCMQEATEEAIVSSHLQLGHYNYQKVLDIYGDRVVVFRCEQDKDINKYIKQCSMDHVKTVDFENIGHIFNLENPSLFNQEVERVLRGAL